MTGLITKIGRVKMLALDSLATALPVPSVDEKQQGKVLVVRLDAMGDLVLSTDALRAIRELYPPGNWQLTLAVNAMWAGLLTGQGFADNLLALDRSRFLSSSAYRFAVMREVRRQRFDLALNPVSSREAMLGDALVRASMAPQRIGWETGADNISKAGRIISDRWYTRLLPNPGPDLMELERNALFLRHLGSGDVEGAMPKLVVQPGWTREARDLLMEKGVGERFVVLVPGTGPPAERGWPPHKWARLSEKIVEKTGFDVVLCGGGDDGRKTKEITGLSKCAVSDLTGATSVERLAGVISLAGVVVGSDTGPVHLASAVQTPSVCILGGAFPGRFFPYSVAGPGPAPVVVSSGECTCARWNCRRLSETEGTFPCIDGVGSEAVFSEVVRIVGNHPAVR